MGRLINSFVDRRMAAMPAVGPRIGIFGPHGGRAVWVERVNFLHTVYTRVTGADFIHHIKGDLLPRQAVNYVEAFSKIDNSGVKVDLL